MLLLFNRFLQNGSEEYGVHNSELGDYVDDDEDEEMEEEEEELEQDGVDEDGEPIFVRTTRKKKKSRPVRLRYSLLFEISLSLLGMKKFNH